MKMMILLVLLLELTALVSGSGSFWVIVLQKSGSHKHLVSITKGRCLSHKEHLYILSESLYFLFFLFVHKLWNNVKYEKEKKSPLTMFKMVISL